MATQSDHQTTAAESAPLAVDEPSVPTGTSPPRQRSPLWAVLALAALLAVTAAVRYRYLETPLERDEGEFAYGGQLLLAGEMPYTSIYAMKLPGIYVAYALIEGSLGQTIWAIHLGLLLVNLASVVLVYLLGRRLFDPVAGLIAAAAFAVMSFSPLVQGTQAQAEHFVLLAALAGILLLETARQQPSRWRFFAAGLALGSAFLTKQHGFAFVLFGFAYLALAEPSRWRSQPGRLAGELGLLAAGIALPWIIVCMALAAAGAFDDFVFWTVTYPSKYVSLLSWRRQQSNMWSAYVRQTSYVGPLWIAAALGMTATLWYRTGRSWRLCLWLLLLCAILATMPGGYFRKHYFVLLTAPLALWSAAGLRGLGAVYRAHGGGPVLPVFVVLLAFAWPVASLAMYYAPLDNDQLSHRLYPPAMFPEYVSLGDYLAERTSPDDTIGVLGSEPQIFFYAKRRSASGHVYMYPLTERHPYARQLQRQFIDDLESARPRYVLVTTHSNSWINTTGGDFSNLDAWFNANLSQSYRVVGIALLAGPGRVEYLWDAEAADATVRAAAAIVIYERREEPN